MVFEIIIFLLIVSQIDVINMPKNIDITIIEQHPPVSDLYYG
jgi:hypothetical protein